MTPFQLVLQLDSALDACAIYKKKLEQEVADGAACAAELYRVTGELEAAKQAVNFYIKQSNLLRNAIEKHHEQKADDRCFLDDDELYAAACLPAVDRRVGDKAEMLKNCARFLERRCEGGHWPTYAELEKQLAQSPTKFLQELREWQLATFPGEDLPGVYAHLKEELAELRIALSSETANVNDVGAEIADCLMLLCCLCFHLKLDPIEVMRDKHAINLQRTWVKTEKGMRHEK